jgi:diacylglycerol kinase (ATP)
MVAAWRRFVFFVNPAARDGSAERRLRWALAGRPDIEQAADVVPVSHPSDVRVCGLPDHTLVVAVGGDGTVNLVATALHKQGANDRPLAVIPLGTGNALAQSLQIRTVESGMRALESGHTCRLDRMRTSLPERPLALVSVSTGFESAFLCGVARWRPRTRWGGLYALPRALPRRRCGTELVLDGERVLAKEDGFYNVGLYNMPCYAFGWRVVQGVDPQDGRGDAALHHRAPGYWRALAGACLGRPVPASTTRQWRKARLTLREPAQIDGEVIAARRLFLWIEPMAQRMVVPRTYAERR